MGRLPALAAQRVTGEVPRDMTEPGAQAGGIAQTAQLFPGGHECLLGQVFALAQVAGRAEGERTNQVPVPRDDVAKGITTADHARSGY